jgi:hypothetical protein
MEDQSMHSTLGTTWKIGMIAAILAIGLTGAASAEAGESRRGELINDHLDFFAVVAAIAGDYELALALDRRGDRIEHRLDQRRGADRDGSRQSRWRQHRRFSAWAHGTFRDHDRRHDRGHRRWDKKREHRKRKHRHQH